MGSRSAGQAERVERVRTVAAQLFAERGYAGTTVPAIADAAGVSVGTVNNVGDKDSLFLEAVETSGTDWVLQRIAEIRRLPGLGLAERVALVCTSLLEGAITDIERNRDYLIAFLRTRDRPDNGRRLSAVTEAFAELWVGAGSGDPEHLREAALVTYTALNGTIFGVCAGAIDTDTARRLVASIVSSNTQPFEKEATR